MLKIIADDKIPFLKGALEPYAEVVYLPGKEINNLTARDADALLIRTRTKCSGEMLRDTNIRFIGTATIGYDHIDTVYCDNHNIRWTNAPGCNSSSVRQYIAAAILRLTGATGFTPADKTIGIVGVGNVGSKVKAFTEAIGMKVLLNDPPRMRKEGGNNFVSLDKLLHESDIVTVHVPLEYGGDDQTFHLFNSETFGKMKDGAWFINSSRGEVTETAALKKALHSGRIAGSVIDVWEHEPEIDNELLESSFISTPHIAGYSTDGKANGTAMVVNALAEFYDLPLRNWYPEEIPLPAESIIHIDATGLSDHEIVSKAVMHSYDIMGDDQRLRMSPGYFEKLRGDYPLRREFSSYTVHLKNGNESTATLLQNIGFSVSTLNPQP